MNIKNILENYNEYSVKYYMNNQNLIDNYNDYKLAEKEATRQAIKMLKK